MTDSLRVGYVCNYLLLSGIEQIVVGSFSRARSLHIGTLPAPLATHADWK